MIVIEIDQLSTQWFAERAGIPTASNFDKIVTSKGEPSKQAQKYMHQLAGESITGTKEETYSNFAMQRGIEMEPEARQLYEFVTGNKVDQVGFCYPDEQKRYGCSPDGLVGDDGLIEIKCTLLSTSVEYLIADKLPTTYVQQVQGELLITGREWCDFMSYFPGLPPLIVRVARDEKFIKKMAEELDRFCYDLAALIKSLKEKIL